jgi:hypothetical protein
MRLFSGRKMLLLLEKGEENGEDEQDDGVEGR